MILRLKRTPGIYLVGFMGSGKSTLGRLLAEEIGWTFLDLDEVIERQAGASISSLFESRGEPAFRELETRTLSEIVRKVEQGLPHIVALGGGTYVQPGNAQLLRANGVTVYLECPLAILESRVARHHHRPLARDLERFRRLYAERAPLYSQADYRLEVGEAEASVHLQALLQLPLFQK